jgi:hypothetical protein
VQAWIARHFILSFDLLLRLKGTPSGILNVAQTPFQNQLNPQIHTC